MTESIVEVSHLRKSYGKVEALKGISFEVRKEGGIHSHFFKRSFSSKMYKGVEKEDK